MPEAPCRTRLALKASEELRIAHEFRRNQFDRNIPAGAQVNAQVNRPHPTLALEPFEAVFPIEGLADETTAVLPTAGLHGL
jgi:hypothetical protein